MTTATKTSLTVALFGSRGVGERLLVRALRAGHAVRVLVRSRERLESRLSDLTAPERERLMVIVGDATDDTDVGRTIEGADAVLCALGAPPSDRSFPRARGTDAIIRAMRERGVTRIVAVSTFGARDSRGKLPFWVRYLLFPLVLKHAVADHERQEELLEHSGLRWTVVRPPNLIDAPATHRVVRGVDDLSELTMTVSRDDVASFMIDLVEGDDQIAAAVAISRKRPVVAAPSRTALVVYGLRNAALSGVISSGLTYAVLPRPDTLGAHALAHGVTGAICAFIATIVTVRAGGRIQAEG